MKKATKRLSAAAIAFVLAALMAFQFPAQVLADAKPEYISEIKISIAAGKNDSQKSAAQKELTDAGYTLLTHSSDYAKDGKTVFKKGDAVDMNYGTDVALTSEPPAVYLGYKTTTDKDDAITDISMMEMAKESDKSQPYSFAAYDEMLKEYKKQINASIENIEDTLTEFSSNYEKGSPAAKWAYTQLNRYTDPDSDDKKIGDIFLAMVSEGFSDDEKEQLQNYYLKGNINFVNGMNSYLAVGCAEYQTETTWIDRFAAADPDEEYEKSYDDTVTALLNGWESFYDVLYKFKKTGLKSDVSEEDLQSYINKQLSDNKISSDDMLDIMFGATCTKYLAEYKYDGQSMIDFFLQDRDPDNIDKETLIPLANALTNGQRATVESVGLRGLFSGLQNTEKYWSDSEEQVEKLLEENDFDDDDTVSIYQGTNEAMYKSDGVALTNEAMTAGASQEDGFFDSIGGDMLLGAIVGAIGCLSFALSSYAYWLILMDKVDMFFEAIEDYATAYQAYVTTGAKMAIGATIGLSLLCLGFSIGMFIYDYYHNDYTEIPGVMVDAVNKKNKQGIENTYYVYYDAVKCDYDSQNNRPADTNAWTGKRWNAMYVTKDETAGDPILAKDFCAQYGSKEKSGYTNVSRFHEKSAYNMNAHHYGDDVNGIYLFYKTNDVAIDYEGTALTPVSLGLGIGGGAIGGIIIGMLAMNSINKKKKPKEA